VAHRERAARTDSPPSGCGGTLHPPKKLVSGLLQRSHAVQVMFGGLDLQELSKGLTEHATRAQARLHDFTEKLAGEVRDVSTIHATRSPAPYVRRR
jgi:hypothetical protein